MRLDGHRNCGKMAAGGVEGAYQMGLGGNRSCGQCVRFPAQPRKTAAVATQLLLAVTAVAVTTAVAEGGRDLGIK